MHFVVHFLPMMLSRRKRTIVNEMTRRGFIGAMGTVLVSANAVTFAKGDESTSETPGIEEETQEQVWTPRDPYPGETAKNLDIVPTVATPAPSILTEEEVDSYIKNEIVVTEDYVKADGSVVPAAYINMRNKINRNGIGIGSTIETDDHWDVWMHLATEEEAALFSEMPDYVEFTAADFALKSGRPEAECREICEGLAQKGLLGRMRRNGNAYYRTQTQEYGIYETVIKDMDVFTKEFLDDKDSGDGKDKGLAFLDSGTSMYRTYPVDLSVVRGEYTPFDDWRSMIDRYDTLSVSPCVCRYKQMIQAGTDHLDCGHAVCGDGVIETCICTGEQAEFMIEIGAGRPITTDEAKTIIGNAVDEGMIVETVFTRNAENICLCHSDCCLNVGAVRRLNGGPAIESYSNFYLAHDEEECLKCGACVDRCPMHSIVMDEVTDLPVVDNACVRCGQCALVCPAGARGLVLKPEEDRPYIPRCLAEDNEIKARVRAAKGYLFDYSGQKA